MQEEHIEGRTLAKNTNAKIHRGKNPTVLLSTNIETGQMSQTEKDLEMLLLKSSTAGCQKWQLQSISQKGLDKYSGNVWRGYTHI